MKVKILAFSLLLFSVACKADLTAEVTVIPSPTSPVFVTATLPATRTPYPSATLALAPSATPIAPIAPVEGQATTQLNVREAPSVSSNQIGTIDIFAKVQIIGKDPSDSWWMILFSDSPSGKGWVSAQYLQVADSSGVPVVQNGNQVPETEASPDVEVGDAPLPTAIPTESLKTARLDGDSAESPSVNVTLSEKSLPSFSHNDDLSIPEGDAEDWLRFALEGTTGQEKIISVVLDCSGGSALNLELIQNGVVLQNWEEISCGQRRQLQLYLFVSAPYSLRLYPVQNNTSLNYLAYTITVQLVK